MFDLSRVSALPQPDLPSLAQAEPALAALAVLGTLLLSLVVSRMHLWELMAWRADRLRPWPWISALRLATALALLLVAMTWAVQAQLRVSPVDHIPGPVPGATMTQGTRDVSRLVP